MPNNFNASLIPGYSERFDAYSFDNNVFTLIGFLEFLIVLVFVKIILSRSIKLIDLDSFGPVKVNGSVVKPFVVKKNINNIISFFMANE